MAVLKQEDCTARSMRQVVLGNGLVSCRINIRDEVGEEVEWLMFCIVYATLSFYDCAATSSSVIVLIVAALCCSAGFYIFVILSELLA